MAAEPNPETQRDPMVAMFALFSAEDNVFEGDAVVVPQSFKVLLESFADDVVFHVESGVKGFRGDYHGHDGVMEYWRKVAEAGASIHHDIQDIARNEHFVTTLLKATTHREADGAEMAVSLCSVSRLAGDKVAEVWMLSSSLGDPGASQFFDHSE